MLEGSVVNGTISRQMVDTLVESSANVELILNYFKLFLNLPSEDDLGLEDGCIHPKDFKEKLEGMFFSSLSCVSFLARISYKGYILTTYFRLGCSHDKYFGPFLLYIT